MRVRPVLGTPSPLSLHTGGLPTHPGRDPGRSLVLRVSVIVNKNTGKHGDCQAVRRTASRGGRHCAGGPATQGQGARRVPGREPVARSAWPAVSEALL